VPDRHGNREATPRPMIETLDMKIVDPKPD